MERTGDATFHPRDVGPDTTLPTPGGTLPTPDTTLPTPDTTLPTPGSTQPPARRRTAVAALDLPVPAPQVWALVADVRNHDRWIPLTRIDAAPALGVGDTFVAVTGPRATRGGGGLRDSMTVTRSDPPTATTPGVGVYRKTGPVLRGEATVHVRPTGPASCTLIWTEDVHLRGLPRALTAPLLRPLTAVMLRRALRAIRAELT